MIHVILVKTMTKILKFCYSFFLLFKYGENRYLNNKQDVVLVRVIKHRTRGIIIALIM